MFPDLTDISIYIRPGFTDMRKQINGLSVIAEDEMNLNSGSGSLFLFCNKSRRVIKCIYWDRNGFCLWQKKLEVDRFPWPRTEKEAQEITSEQLNLLLQGIDFWKAHKEITFQEMN